MAHGNNHNVHEHAGVHDVHYDKSELLKDYKLTFRIFITGLMVAVLMAVAYFFALAVYLGGWGHTKAAPFVQEFGDRAMPTYKGLKLPEFGGPAAPATHEEPAKPAEEKK
jgi:hypothetical protein